MGKAKKQELAQQKARKASKNAVEPEPDAELQVSKHEPSNIDPFTGKSPDYEASSPASVPTPLRESDVPIEGSLESSLGTNNSRLTLKEQEELKRLEEIELRRPLNDAAGGLDSTLAAEARHRGLGADQRGSDGKAIGVSQGGKAPVKKKSW